MSLEKNQFDAAILGGGIIGCAIAWRLGQTGKRVVVIDRGTLGREASWAAGGMLAPLAEADQIDAFFELAVASRAMYAEFARELQSATDIDIEYRTEGTLYLALSEEDEEELEHRWQWQQTAGLNVNRLSAEAARNLEPLLTPKLRWALHFPDDHQVDNRRLMVALEAAARKVGVEFWTDTETFDIAASPSRIAGLTTSRGEIKTQTAIIAAGAWSSLLPIQAHEVEVIPVRGQMVALEMPRPALRHVVYSSSGYVVPRLSGYVIAGSTTENAGYEKRTTASGIASILDRAIEIAPALAEQSVIETWAGLRPRTRDNWPILGLHPTWPGLVYATGHYRNGILLAPITAQIICELVTRGECRLDLNAFSLTRFDQDLRRSA